MSLYKRGKTWWVAFTTPGGERIRQSAGTQDRTQAQELHDRLKAEAWRVVQLGDKPSRTWDEAALQWLMETQHKATHEEDKDKLRWLQAHFRGQYLHTLSRERIQQIGALKAAEASKPTANRYLALIRSILRRAEREWEWIERAPKIRLYKETGRRVRWLTRTQAESLLHRLAPHQSEMARFALATGLRQTNILELEWSQIDMSARKAWVHHDQAKARKAVGVPLNDDAIAVLRRQIGKHLRVVFTYRGRPVKQVNTKAWRKALADLGITDFRWHDLRHTWASWHVQNGTPLHVLKELGGWETMEMVLRYAHLAADHLAAHAGNVLVDKTATVTILAQPGKQAEG